MAQKVAPLIQKKSIPKVIKPSASTTSSSNHTSSNSINSSRKQVEFSQKEKTYFYGSLPFDDIELILKKIGDFLIRNVDEPHGSKVFVLTVKTNNIIKNYAIKFKNGEYYITDKKAKSVHELLDLHIKQNIPVSDDVFIKSPIHHPRWILRHDDFRFGKKLGEGAFGEVYLSRYKVSSGDKCKMAVKTMHNKVTYENKLEFLKEARIMTKFEHQNIVRVFGVAVLGSPVIFAMEICPGGSLLGYLRSGKDLIPVPTKSRFAYEAAKGLAYLEKQGYIHRDIAARNCMLTRNLTIKVGDFGMSEQTSEMVVDKLEKVPIKWLAIETMQKRIYSHKTDVWSFGVLLWEIYSNGEQPYSGYSNIQVRAKVVVQGYRMPVPMKTPEVVGELMKKCWLADPNQRPAFAELEQEIQKYAEPPPSSKRKGSKKKTKRQRAAKKDKSVEEKTPISKEPINSKPATSPMIKDPNTCHSKEPIKLGTPTKEGNTGLSKEMVKSSASKEGSHGLGLWRKKLGLNPVVKDFPSSRSKDQSSARNKDQSSTRSKDQNSARSKENKNCTGTKDLSSSRSKEACHSKEPISARSKENVHPKNGVIIKDFPSSKEQNSARSKENNKNCTDTKDLSSSRSKKTCHSKEPISSHSKENIHPKNGVIIKDFPSSRSKEACHSKEPLSSHSKENIHLKNGVVINDFPSSRSKEACHSKEPTNALSKENIHEGVLNQQSKEVIHSKSNEKVKPATSKELVIHQNETKKSDGKDELEKSKTKH